ncbi:MAG: hypothetical protein J7K23_01375 [Thermoproteales archaeon]|nr:hypothetical protein [Thermoproteales archaeon]
MGKRYSEHTEKKGLFDDYYETHVTDRETGKRGKGVDRDKGKSIDKAWKDLRERQGK